MGFIWDLFERCTDFYFSDLPVDFENWNQGIESPKKELLQVFIVCYMTHCSAVVSLIDERFPTSSRGAVVDTHRVSHSLSNGCHNTWRNKIEF